MIVNLAGGGAVALRGPYDPYPVICALSSCGVTRLRAGPYSSPAAAAGVVVEVEVAADAVNEACDCGVMVLLVPGREAVAARRFSRRPSARKNSIRVSRSPPAPADAGIPPCSCR